MQLKPRPWLERWERQELKGVQDLGLPERFYKRAAEVASPWEKYDLMKEYRWDACSSLLQCAAYMRGCYHYPFCHFFVKHRQCTVNRLKNPLNVASWEVLQQQSRTATGGEGHALAVTCPPSWRLQSVLDQSMWDLWHIDRFYLFFCQCCATNCHTHSFIARSLLFHQWLLMYVFVRFGVHRWYCWGFRCGMRCFFHWVNGLHVAWECSAFIFKGCV